MPFVQHGKRQNPHVQPMTAELRRCIHSNAVSFSRAPSVAGGPSMEIDVKKCICKRLKQTRCLQSWRHYMAGRAGGPPTHVETKLIPPCRVRRRPLHLLSGLWLQLERRLWPLGAEETKLAYRETCDTIRRVCRQTASAAILDWTRSFLAEPARPLFFQQLFISPRGFIWSPALSLVYFVFKHFLRLNILYCRVAALVCLSLCFSV